MLEDGRVVVVAAAAFTVAAVLHGLRIAMGWSFVFGPYSIPVWLSALDVAISGPLAVYFWKRVMEKGA